MAWNWNFKPVATVKVESAADSDKMLTFQGCTTGNISPETAVEHINTILDIGGLSAVVSEKMTRTQTEGAEENG